MIVKKEKTAPNVSVGADTEQSIQKCTENSIAIDTIAVENEIADNMYQRSELDYLIYNDPVAYAELILNGDPETYLKTVTEYRPLDR